MLNKQYVFTPSGTINFNLQMNSFTVVLYDKSFVNQGIGTESNKVDYLVFHHATVGWRYPVIFERNEAMHFLSEFQGEIIVFTEDYDEFKKEISLLSNKRTFYRYDGMWKNFIKQIRSQKTPYIHLQK